MFIICKIQRLNGKYLWKCPFEMASLKQYYSLSVFGVSKPLGRHSLSRPHTENTENSLVDMSVQSIRYD